MQTCHGASGRELAQVLQDDEPAHRLGRPRQDVGRVQRHGGAARLRRPGRSLRAGADGERVELHERDGAQKLARRPGEEHPLEGARHRGGVGPEAGVAALGRVLGIGVEAGPGAEPRRDLLRDRGGAGGGEARGGLCALPAEPGLDPRLQRGAFGGGLGLGPAGLARATGRLRDELGDRLAPGRAPEAGHLGERVEEARARVAGEGAAGEEEQLGGTEWLLRREGEREPEGQHLEVRPERRGDGEADRGETLPDERCVEDVGLGRREEGRAVEPAAAEPVGAELGGLERSVGLEEEDRPVPGERRAR